jgi:hypothetical protein
MFSRKPLVAALAVVVLGAASGVTTSAHPNATHSMYVTFNGAVSLPGVTLAAGTYVFEIPEATSDHSLVRVSSKDRSTVYLTAFTNPVDRPARMKTDRVISFTETAPGRPSPIAVWWPDDSQGREFIYSHR